MSTEGTSANLPMSGSHTGSHFSALPKTTMGWVAVAVAVVYIVFATLMANTTLGLPTWLDFSLGLLPGAAAAILIGIAMIRERERSWLLWLAAAGVLFYFGGWLVFLVLAS